jgi:phage terminase Nu1 subunit (DNA packaging protein)
VTGTGRKRVRTVALPLVLAALIFIVSGCGDLSNDELNRGVESLSTLAAQGQLVANGVARDGTKTTYARAMARTLGEQAEHEAEKLADATLEESETEDQRHAAVAVAGEISGLLSELQTFPGDERHGELVEQHLGEAQEKADAIVAQLSGDAP